MFYRVQDHSDTYSFRVSAVLLLALAFIAVLALSTHALPSTAKTEDSMISAMNEIQNHRWSTAHKILIRALKREPNSGALWSMRGQVEQSMGNYDAAINSLEKAIELDPTTKNLDVLKSTKSRYFAELICRSRNRYDNRKELQIAVHDLKKAISLYDVATAHLLLADVLDLQGDPLAADSERAKAKQLDPSLNKPVPRQDKDYSDYPGPT